MRGKGDGLLVGSHDDDSNWERVKGRATPLRVQVLWRSQTEQRLPAASRRMQVFSLHRCASVEVLYAYSALHCSTLVVLLCVKRRVELSPVVA